MRTIERVIQHSPALMFVAAAVCFFTRGAADATFLVAAGILTHLLLKRDNP